ncbi:MAG: hypothetical protein NVS1B4_22100 [Gemmatimonadaceae bacterium]
MTSDEIGYVFPPHDSDVTASVITMASFALELFFASTTRTAAVAPAGTVTPPATVAALVVAVKVCPADAVLVQMRVPDTRSKAVPLGIEPTAPPPDVLLPASVRVTVFPERVVAGAGAGRGVTARAVVVGAGAGVVVRLVVVVVVVVVCATAAGAGAAAEDAGTSRSCGWTAESRRARLRSRFSVVSCTTVVSFFVSVVHAAIVVARHSAIPTWRIYSDLIAFSVESVEQDVSGARRGVVTNTAGSAKSVRGASDMPPTYS